MATPVWTTTAGKIATIDEQGAYSLQLEANTSDSTTITYSVIAGSLPAGMQVTTDGLLTGTPAEVAKRTLYTFVVRATAGTAITDRTFSLDVEGADTPTFTTASGQLQLDDSTSVGLYWVIDGSSVNLQMQATDSDTEAGQKLVYSVVQGELPPGVTMSPTGLISGIVQLTDDERFGIRGGYDGTGDADEFNGVYDRTVTTKSISKNFDFIVRVSDGTSFIEQNNSIFVYTADFWRVSNTAITIDKTEMNGSALTMDLSANRRPVFRTGSDLGTFRHDNALVVKIDVEDFDPTQNDLEYSIQSGSLPAGVAIDINSGELYGQLARQLAVEVDYNFTVRANRVVVTGLNVFTDQAFTMKVIGEIDIGITSGSLPPGITLSTTGNLIGTIDPSEFTDSTRAYTFTATVSDQYQSLAASKEFTINIDIPYTQVEYGNMSGHATSFIDQNIFYNVAQDPNINSTENIFRSEDTNFGFKVKPDMLMMAGLEAQTLTAFQQEMEKNHAPKTLYFGDLKTAVAKEDGVVKYEVVYIDMIDDLVGGDGVAVGADVPIGEVVRKPLLGPTVSTVDITADMEIYEFTHQSGLAFSASGSKVRFANQLSADLDFVTTLFPNAVANMRSRMKALGHKEWDYLPLWMKTTQAEGLAPLGYVKAVPVCYCKPGKSALVKKRIEDKALNFKNISFTIDRYVVSNSKVATDTFTADGTTTNFVVDELLHEEDILVKEGSNIVFVGQGVTADNNIKPTYLTADGTLRSADHELGITLSHDTSNQKTTITFTKETPQAGTIIKVERSNDKYLKFRDKGI